MPFRFLSRRTISVAMTSMAAAALGMIFSTAASAETWPSKNVSIVVGVPAGGALDPFARALAEQLRKETGGTFIVENRPGANGSVSAEAVLKSPADGHTLWIGTQGMVAINPSAFPSLRWKASDFTPIIKAVEAPLVLVTSPAVPAKDFDALTKWIKAAGDKASYGSYSPGTPGHFLGFQLNEHLGASMVHIPYSGSSQQITDILGGQIPLGFTQLAAAIPHVKAGKLHAVAVTSPERSRYLPDVPTLAELGYEDLGTTVWFGLYAPAKTPPEVVEQIRAAAQKAQHHPEYRAQMEMLYFDLPEETPQQFEANTAKETARWAEIVEATGFRGTN